MPERVIRWLHLSDFHFGKSYGVKSACSSLLKEIEKRCEAGNAPDLMFVTGDVANKGKKSEYDEFIINFYQPLQELLGEKHDCKLFVVPGNHDVNRQLAKNQFLPTHNFFEEVPGIFEPSAESCKARKNIFPRYEAFVQASLPPENGSWLLSDDGFWAGTLDLRGINLGILLVNTAWLSNKQDEKGQLSIGRYILEEGIKRIRSSEIKIVLGHHPLDWLTVQESSHIRQQLGEYNSIYLHGHLHGDDTWIEDCGSSSFRVVQSGAVFEPDSRIDIKSRLVWAELDLDAGSIVVEPLFRVGSGWRPDTAAFTNTAPLPDYRRWRLPLPGRTLLPPLPPGWEAITAESLEQARQEKTGDEEILAYFDGREPSWRVALSQAVPRRAAVKSLANSVKKLLDESSATFTLLTGPSGEGKSTILRQTLEEVLREDTDVRVYWRDNLNAGLPLDFVKQLSRDTAPYLFVSDEMDGIYKDVNNALRWVAERPARVNFLGASRGTSWKAVEANQIPWRTFSKYIEMPISGIEQPDAELIVGAWLAASPSGIKQLHGKSIEEAARLLVGKANAEQIPDEGSFFGALLDLREDATSLRDRLISLLSQLSRSQLTSGINLAYAFAFIAAPHKVGIRVLTKKILARALGVEVPEIDNNLLPPLVKEAIMAGQGEFVTTRHQKIAQAAWDVLTGC